MAVTRPSEPDGVSAMMPLRASSAGGSGSFLILADDGHRYWCKSLNNFQGDRVPVTEQIVARLGGLIDAPVCEPALVKLDPIVGWEIRPGSDRFVEAGWAHGSLALEPALETRSLDHRSDDDNRKRHCGIYALCDWLAGGDIQWLYSTAEDNAYYSHDHGFYLTGPAWTAASLDAAEHVAFALSHPPARLERDELVRIAESLERMSREDIEREVSKLPTDWPVSDSELDRVAQFVDVRRVPVAARLRALVA